jgi:hypothetical protein
MHRAPPTPQSVSTLHAIGPGQYFKTEQARSHVGLTVEHWADASLAKNIAAPRIAMTQNNLVTTRMALVLNFLEFRSCPHQCASYKPICDATPQ